MTDLQMSLIALGVVFIVAIWLYSRNQEKRAKQNVERAFGNQVADDVLMSSKNKAESEPVEPSVGHADARVEPVVSEMVYAQVKAPEEALADELEETLSNIIATSKEPPIDSKIDCLIPISLEEPLRGERLLPLLEDLRHIGGKRLHFMGYVKDVEEGTEPWQAIAHGQIYHALRLGVQLANRHGVLNEIEYSELVMRLQDVMEDIGGEPDVPDMLDVMKDADAVRKLVDVFDARLSVNLRAADKPWEINTLLRVLELQGFDMQADGQLRMLDAQGGLLFILLTNEPTAAEHTSRLTLLLDVPCVSPEQDGFGMMSACAKVLVDRLDAVIVDDEDQALTDDMLDEIEEQVQDFYREMENADVPGGSTRAKRLFS